MQCLKNLVALALNHSCSVKRASSREFGVPDIMDGVLASLSVDAVMIVFPDVPFLYSF